MDPQETAALRRQLLDDLVAEALEHLDAADAVLDAAERDGLDADRQAGLMRAMHSIKGAAGYMQLTDIQGLAHALETIAQQPASADADAEALCVELLLAGTAELRALVEHADTPGPASPELLEALASAGALTNTLALRPVRPALGDIFRDVVLQQCQAICSALPHLSTPGDAAGRTTVCRALNSLRSAAEYAGRDDVLAMVEAVLAEEDTPEATTLAELAEVLTGLLGEPMAATRQPDGQEPAPTDRPATPGAEHQASPPSPVTSPDARTASALDPTRTLRVPPARVDALIGQVSELLTVRSQLDHFLRQVETAGLSTALSRQGRQLGASLGRAIDDVQSTAMELRLVRLETVFRRLPRVCRDTATRTSRVARLELQGGETEVDKGVAEALADPLLHLLRNAIDHGIERPGERRAAGKPDEGVVLVSARQDGSEVVVEVRDDGRGIDEQQVLRRAVEQGILDAQTAAELSPDGALQILFEPGFSTAATVSDISGRGVGLDVVRANVSQLGGTVAVRRLPVGTAFELRIPVRLAATDVVLVQAGGETFAVALDGVRETLFITPDRTRLVAGRPAIVHHGRVVPIVRLAEVAGLAGSGCALSPDGDEVLIAEVAGQPVGLAVDEIGQHQQVVAKPLESYLVSPGLSEAAVLGDGRVVMVVSPGRLVASVMSARSRALGDPSTVAVEDDPGRPA